MPNRENIRKWVDALRSGDYRQGRGALRSGYEPETSYCCLGVACDVSDVGGWSGNVYRTTDEYGHSSSASSVLPYEVADWLDIGTRDRSNPDLVDIAGDLIDAIAANDSLGWTFDDIADALERTYLRDNEPAQV